MFNLMECHVDKTLTPLFVSPTAIWVDKPQKMNGNDLSYCFTFIDSAKNKYFLFTKKEDVYRAINDFLKRKDYANLSAKEYVVINETNFSSELESSFDTEKEQVDYSVETIKYLMDNYNLE